MGSSPDDAALVWRGNIPVRTRGNDKQASSVLTFGGPTRPKKPVRRCFKSRPSLRTRYAGFASGCRLGVSRTRTFSGGCPASCPDAHQPARDHGHVRNWAGLEIGASPSDHKRFLTFPGFFLRIVLVARRNRPIQPLLSGTGRRRGVGPISNAEWPQTLVLDARKSNSASMMTLSRRIILQGLLASVATSSLGAGQQNGVPAPIPSASRMWFAGRASLRAPPIEATGRAAARAAQHD